MQNEADGALRRLGDELDRPGGARARPAGARLRALIAPGADRPGARAEGECAAAAEAKVNALVAAREHEAASEPSSPPSAGAGCSRGYDARARRPLRGALVTGGRSPSRTHVARPDAAEPHRSREAPAGDAVTRPDLVTLNSATFEQLRGMGMSVTQATRVIAYRERQNGFDAIDDLDAVPGFPAEALARLKERLSA